MAHDLSNDEISVQGEFHRCEACGFESRDDAFFSVHGWGTQCAPGYGCNTDRPFPLYPIERDPDEAYDDAVDAALERVNDEI
jgi:hypothetical protein